MGDRDLCDGRSGDRHRRGPGPRPGPRPRVRRRGREGRRQRPRRRARRLRPLRHARPSEVVDEIVAVGGEAVADGDDVADWDGAEAIVASSPSTRSAASTCVVNNAGIVRDRMFVNCRARTSGTPSCGCTSRATSRPPATPRPTGGTAPRRASRSTPASSTRRRAPGSWARSARPPTRRPRAASPRLTLVQAAELGRFGVTANAIAPAARTRMTEEVFADTMAAARARAPSTRWRPRTCRRSWCGWARRSRPA